MKEEATDYLELETIKNLVRKYSQFINFPIYVWASKVLEWNYSIFPVLSFICTDGTIIYRWKQYGGIKLIIDKGEEGFETSLSKEQTMVNHCSSEL